MAALQRIAVTPGEPAGIGPDLVIALAAEPRDSELIAIADPNLLLQRCRMLGTQLSLVPYDRSQPAKPGKAGQLLVESVRMASPCTPGRLDPANGSYVIKTLERATQGCLQGEFDAMLTAPVQKSTIVESGTPFSGHTEFLAEQCGVETPVMLLCAEKLRVALVTTHLPLSAVPAQITAERIETICSIVATDLQRLFGIAEPRIAVLGLNPHAGEAGQLGREEIEVIEPALQRLRQRGLNISGPLPADSAFTPAALEQCDAVVAMFHDQGLPVLKHAGFGGAVNITLGLPIIRTSVDHGTALDLAGTGRASVGSLRTALRYAEDLIRQAHA